jgi:hypothetical protein
MLFGNSTKRIMLNVSRLKRPLLLSTTCATPIIKRTVNMGSAASGSSATRTSSISDTIKHDHVALRNGYNKILGTTDLDEKRRWQNQFTWDLARHAVGEELVVYPALEKVLADGKRVADRDRKEHQTVLLPPHNLTKESFFMLIWKMGDR